MQGDPDIGSIWEEPDLQLLRQLAVGLVGGIPPDSHDTLDSLFVFQYGLSEANSGKEHLLSAILQELQACCQNADISDISASTP